MPPKRTRVASAKKSGLLAAGKELAFQSNFPGKRSRTGWQLPDKLDLDQWTTCGRGLSQMEGAVQWWLGDWWVYGEHAYGERKALFEEGGQLEGLNFGTLMNYGSIAGRIATSHRCEVLSFKHHEHVAALPPAQQRKWLERAVKEDWSARQLKAAIAAGAESPAAPAVSNESPAESPVAPAVSDEKRKAADETVLSTGGQVVDVEKLSPEAKDRLDRIHEGQAWNGYPLGTMIVPMLESMLDKGPQSLESLVEIVAGGHWFRGAVDKISGGVQGFTVTLLDQLVDRGFVVPENDSWWKLGPAFKTGEALIVVPQCYSDGDSLTVWVWTKEERAEQCRQSGKRMDAIAAEGKAKLEAYKAGLPFIPQLPNHDLQTFLDSPADYTVDERVELIKALRLLASQCDVWAQNLADQLKPGTFEKATASTSVH